MARPIRETPILMGEDAVRFMSNMEAVDQLSAEQRAANRAAFEARLENASHLISFCL